MEEWMYKPNQSFGLDSSAYDLGGSGNNYNTVSYTPSYGGTDDYNVGGSGGSGGNYNTVSYTPSYGGTDDYNVGGSGGSGGSFDTVSYTPSYNPGAYDNYGGGNGAPYWDTPTFAPTFTMQQGLGTNPYAMGAGFSGTPTQQNLGGATATMQIGGGAQTVGGQTFAGPNTTITSAPSSSVGGGLGVDPRQYQLGNNNNNTPALLESASTTGANRQLSNMAFDQAQENTSGRGVRDWVRDPENRDTVRLGIQGLGALAGYKAQRDAGKLAKEQMGLQAQNMAAQKAAYDREMSLREEAMASQRAALGQNQQMAQRANRESIQSFDEARSLYNPQELGIRGMAQQRGTTQRSIEDTRKTLAGRGLSAAAIEAEIRRQRLAGATNETTAYMRGLDTGRSAQAGALSSAKALGSTVPGLSYSQGPNAPTFTPNYSGAEFYSKQGADNSKALRDLLESYADYPTLRAQEEARRDMQRRSNT